jgi:hypothetical protein
VGVDLVLGDQDYILMGLAYALDIPLPAEVDGGSNAHRVFMSVGYRF